MSAALVTLDEAKTHLRLPLTDTSHDADLMAKLDAAEAIILDYLNLTPAMRDTTAAWSAATVPLPAKHAILLELGELWWERGDDREGPPRWTPTDGQPDLAPWIIGVLRRIQPLVVA